MSTAPFHKQPVSPPRHNDKRKIVEHYDFVSPYYQSLWGEHLHHGYWIRGDESKEEAQLQLVEHLAELANIQTGSTVLDIGCGFGGSSIYLAQKYKARAIGITISPVQVEMASKAAWTGLKARLPRGLKAAVIEPTLEDVFLKLVDAHPKGIDDES